MSGIPWQVGRPMAAAAAEGPLRFAFWDVCEEIVRDNLANFSRETGIAVEADCVRGDYEAAVGATLQAGRGPDVFHAQRAEASLWADEGLIHPLDAHHPLVAPLLAGMDPALVEGARDGAGRLLGATYYNGGPFALFLRPGGDEGPDTWDDVLDLCHKAKRDGAAEHPFVPRWHSTQTGLVWSLLAHLASEGVADLADPAAEARLADVLGFMLQLVADDLVPLESLDDAGDRPALGRWATGQHAMTFTVDYLAADAHERAGRAVSLPTARLPGRAGTPLMPGQALVCLRAGLSGERLDAALRLAAYLGGSAVHRRWLTERLFAVPRQALLAESEVRRAVASVFADGEGPLAVERLRRSRAAAIVSPASHRPYMLAWTAAADQLVRGPLLRERRIAPEGAASHLLELWARLDEDHRSRSLG